jgi:type II secretory pathway pseudopilin PulG
MKFRSKISFFLNRTGSGFSLIEAVAALLILAMVCAGVMVAVNNSLSTASDSILRMQAFEVARENLETLLGSSSVKENIESGTSEKYPAILWQNTVESFYEPISKRLWIRAVCSAEYPDPNGQTAKVELTDWLTDLSQQQIVELLKEKEKEKQSLDQSDQYIDSIEDAAIYAGVDEETIQKWVENGMPLSPDGKFIKDYLDLYKKTDGVPTPEQKKPVDDRQKPNQPQLTDEELNKMSFCDRMKYLISHNSSAISFEDAMKYFDQCPW